MLKAMETIRKGQEKEASVEVAAKPENSPQQEVEKTDYLIQQIREDVEKVTEELAEARASLGLPTPKEVPPAIQTGEETIASLEKKKSKLKTEPSQEQKEQKELKENDLIISDRSVDASEKILKDSGIPYVCEERTKRQVVNKEDGTEIPGEFVLTILNPESPEEPAPFEFVKKVFQHIKDADIPVRYGKNPEK